MATSSPSPATVTLNLFTVLSESKRIVNAHSRHFLALSVLFLLPLSFSSTVLPTILSLLLSHNLLLLAEDEVPGEQTLAALLLAAAYSLLALLAVATITSSVLHGFYGRPVKLLSAVRSLRSSFFPLLATSMIIALIAAAITAVFSLLLFLAVSAAQLLGFPPNYASPYFLAPAGTLAAALVTFLVYLQLNWTLVPVIVVAESNWGFGAMRRSAGLVHGMKRIAFSLLLFLGFSGAALAWCSIFSAVRLTGGGFDGWRGLEFAVQIVVTATFLTVVLLYSVAANAVLYMYCKAVHGELAGEIAEEFARDYVSLPFDDAKVPHVVSVAYA